MHRWSLKSIFIYKKFYSTKLKKYLNFQEVYKLKIGNENTNEYLKKNNLVVVNNTDEEILQASIEMDDYLVYEAFATILEEEENEDILSFLDKQSRRM